MNDEQIIIINFLRCSPETWFGKKEIARRAVRRRVFEENPHWADEQLVELIAQRVIEENVNGQVRLKEGERNRANVYVSPDEGKPKLFSIEIDEGSSSIRLADSSFSEIVRERNCAVEQESR